MIVVLAGYPGSQKIVKASRYLSNKYLPIYFNVIYLNYAGEINGWSNYISTFLSYLPDNNIIFALDDYLLSDIIDKSIYMAAEGSIGNQNIVCVKLCESTPEEHEEYPVTTQYCIWNREYLIWLLSQVSQPWEFEIKGSAIFKQGDKKVIHRPCLKYFTNSSISSRWNGVRLDGLTTEDIHYLQNNKLIV